MTDQPERWEWVPDYEGLYQVSDLGRVMRSGRILKPSRDGWGYPFVHLSRNGRARLVAVHRLVAAAFLGPCPQGMEVRHLDGDRQNAQLSNLRYGTAVENAADKDRHGTAARGARNANARVTEALVREIRQRYEAGQSQVSIGRELGVSRGCVCHVLSGRTWGHVS